MSKYTFGMSHVIQMWLLLKIMKVVVIVEGELTTWQAYNIIAFLKMSK